MEARCEMKKTSKKGENMKEQHIINHLVKTLDTIMDQINVGDPINFATDRPYKGINAMILSQTQFQSRCWVTKDQLLKLGGKIRPNEKPTYIYDRKLLDVTSKDGKSYKITILEPYQVFNLDQVFDIQGNELVEIHDSQVNQ